jgi:urease accessory protein
MIRLRSMTPGAAAAALFLAWPSAAAAHPAAGPAHGFAHGFLHPLFGGDHLLAMVAVGLWAAQLGGRARWLLPCVFVATLVAGGIGGMGGLAVPAVEAGILISVLVLGALVALALRAPVGVAAAVVAFLALFHGHAHGAEMPAGTSAMAYGLGLTLATALLHLAGIGFAALAQQRVRATAPVLVRAVGAAIGAAGIAIWLL